MVDMLYSMQLFYWVVAMNLLFLMYLLFTEAVIFAIKSIKKFIGYFYRFFKNHRIELLQDKLVFFSFIMLLFIYIAITCLTCCVIFNAIYSLLAGSFVGKFFCDFFLYVILYSFSGVETVIRFIAALMLKYSHYVFVLICLSVQLICELVKFTASVEDFSDMPAWMVCAYFAVIFLLILFYTCLISALFF